MAITESSITLNFSDTNFFRFEDCKGYKDIKNHFKEMDACWYEQATDTLYIIELKDWGDGKLDEESNAGIPKEEIERLKRRITESRIATLVKKSIDSVCMFMSILLEKPYSSNIQACSPFTITKNTKIKLLSIVNWTDNDVTYIDSIYSEYKSRFRPYARLYGIQTFVVMTKEKAAQTFSWIT